MKFQRLSRMVMAGVLCLGSCFLGGSELPAMVKRFQTPVFLAMPEASSFKAVSATRFEVFSKSGVHLGALVFDDTAERDMKLGFAGPVPVGVALKNDGTIMGVLIGPNEETPGFLRRVKKSGFLTRWNGVPLTSAYRHSVDAVTGATRSSSAIKSGVEAISRAAAQRAGMKVPEVAKTDVSGLRARLAKLEGGIAFCDRFAEQWKTKTADEVAVRFAYAVEGAAAGEKMAAAKGVRIFKHGKKVVGEELQKLVAAYKQSPSAANKAAVMAKIEQDVAYLKKAMAEHRAELVKSKSAIEAQLRSLAPVKREGQAMRFRSLEAKKLEAKIQVLAGLYKKSPSAELEKELRAALQKQLDSGLKAMGGYIERKESELKALKAKYASIAGNQAGVIDKRFKELTKHCSGNCADCQGH